MTKKLAYVTVELLFFAAIFAVVDRVSAILDLPPAHLAAFVILGGFASLRMARTLSYNAVMAWLRDPFTITAPDSSGAGDSCNAKPDSVIGELLACPICTGQWSALILVLIYTYYPRLGWTLIIVLGLAGISEVMHWSAERAEWQGRAAREESGATSRTMRPRIPEPIYSQTTASWNRYESQKPQPHTQAPNDNPFKYEYWKNAITLTPKGDKE